MGCHACEPTPPVVVYVDLTAVHTRLDTLEALVSTAAEQIDALSVKTDGLTALITDVAADFAALVAVVAAERENLTPAGQAALDAANVKADAAQAKLADLDVAVGDADGSDVPPPAPEPTPEPAPVEPPVV